jgi:hypothetical protein
MQKQAKNAFQGVTATSITMETQENGFKLELFDLISF